MAAWRAGTPCPHDDTSQLGRRNLKPDQMSYIRGRLYNRRKRTKAEAGAMGGSSKSQSDTCLPDTATAIATAHGVTERTIRRDGKRAEAIDKLAKVSKLLRRTSPVAPGRAGHPARYADTPGRLIAPGRLSPAARQGHRRKTGPAERGKI